MSSSSDDLMGTLDYFSLLEIPLEEIESATSNFAHENLLTQGSSFEVYKGQLLQSGDLINIVARKSLDKNNAAFNEIVISKDIKHKNIVPTFKITKTKDHDQAIIINKHEVNGSLNKHLSGPTLTWLRRLHICVKVAVALKYLHYDAQDNHYFIHGNIKSSKILLDHNWEPKLHGFGFAVKTKKHHPHLTSEYNGTIQYMDPAYETTGGLTHKSDVFSFGVLLFEVLFGREASIENNDIWYFSRLARSHYEGRTLDDLIDPDVREQMNFQSFKIFTETAYYCLKEQQSQRPDMNQVLSKLEKALELQHKHEYPVAVATQSTSSNHLKGKSLNHLKLRLSDIELATNYFSEACCIGSGGYGKVYKAELEHFDDISSKVVIGKNKGVLPKKHSIVAIKRISGRVDRQGEQGFFAEIEMLSKCRHPNIISLLGFCDEGSELILVYEYVSNGSLDDYLGNADNMTYLTWAQRIQICLDIAHGLHYLHTSTEDKQSIIHRDIKSANILLDDNWVAKIGDFGLSKLHHACQQRSTLITNNIAGTELYLDPEYLSTGKLKTKSDIYSFGVVLFEMMCGKLAYDETYNERGLPSIARQCFKEGTLMNLVDPKIKEGDENISMLTGGVNQNSLDTFSTVAYECLAETQSERPTMDVVIDDLVKALNFQKTSKDNLRISLEALKLGTRNFSDSNCIGEGRFWKLYEGKVADSNCIGCTHILAKRWDRKYDQGHVLFLKELGILFQYRHKNIITLVGYCNEMDENIIVYEHASNGRLDKHLCNPSLTWTKRLKICMDVANGLKFLHTGGVEQEDEVKHRDIKSGSILLDGDWNAKIYNFEMSCKISDTDPLRHFDLDAREHSDIYLLGVLFIEMLCGRLVWVEGCDDHSQTLDPLVVRHFVQRENIDKMIFEHIKEQIVPNSLKRFIDITRDCLKDGWALFRSTTSDVVKRLTNALKFQEDYEIWEPKLPIDYQKIISLAKYSKMADYSKIKKSMKNNKKDLYDLFSEGILLLQDKVLFILGSNGERNVMISAKKFLYKNCTSHKWRSVRESRFPRVLMMLDSSNLKIQIKIRSQFLALSVKYKVLLIFRFCGPRISQAKRMYVNLKYKMGNESLCTYFATRREDGWMMIELFQFLNHKSYTDFEVLLESFSRCYCGRDSVYIEGIQFQAVDNAKNEETEKSKEVQQVSKSKLKTDKFSPSKMKVKKDHMTWFSLSEIKKKRDKMLSAKRVVYNYSDVAKQSRFGGAVELQREQVFRIKRKIKSQLLSSHKENVCYLVFKLSNKFCGLHGPVIVRNLFHRRSKETRILYFRSPNPLNLHDTDWIPKKRKDGWMEVILWKFNSNNVNEYDHLFVYLKLVSYEGTMAGLIVRNIEFR